MENARATSYRICGARALERSEKVRVQISMMLLNIYQGVSLTKEVLPSFFLSLTLTIEHKIIVLNTNMP
jgi:hypothetical protein